jgi:EmrB/QacA subfamily drug resistance transporter
MSDDMLNLAIPTVAAELGATVTDVQWILNAYYVALVSFVLVAGSIGDVRGHRMVFTTGIIAFSLGAMLCALAGGVPALVAGRFVQGIGAAMLLTAGLALVTGHTPPEDKNRALGLFFGLVAAVPALGPFLSGALVDLLSWRWLFVAPLILPVAALVVTRVRVPETVRAPGRRPDLLGAVLILIALGSLSVALIVGGSNPLAPVPLAALAIAAAAGVALVVVERRAADPLLPTGLFRNHLFLWGNTTWLLACLASWGAVFFLAVMLQATMGWRPLIAGLTLTPIYLVMMVGSPLMGKVADRVGVRAPIVLGLGIFAIGLFLLSRLGPGSDPVLGVGGALLVFAAGMAIFTAPLASVTIGALDDGDQGVASGVNNAMGQLAGLLGIAILPVAAGLAGVALDDDRFADGYVRALQISALIAVACLILMARALSTRDERAPSPREKRADRP